MAARIGWALFCLALLWLLSDWLIVAVLWLGCRDVNWIGGGCTGHTVESAAIRIAAVGAALAVPGFAWWAIRDRRHR